MNNTPEENIIKQAYDALFDKDEYGNAPDENTFLERLIALECSGKKKLFRTLLESKSNSEVREYLKSKGRDEWEKIISEEYLGKKMTIVDVINNYSKEIKKAFKEKSVKQALEELGIKCRKIDGMILPPEGNQRILPGNNELSDVEKEKIEMNFRRFQEKINILFGDILTVENEIFPGDFEVIVGENENDALRFNSYIAVWIKKLNKTIFINDRVGESTFVCDIIVSEEDMKSKSKKKMKEYLGDALDSVSYSENQKEKWKLNMIDLICGPEKGTQKFIRDELMNENGELTEMGIKRFSLDCSKSNHRRKFKLSNGFGYSKIAGKFGIKRNAWHDLEKDDAFYELSEAIFGKDHPKVIELKKRLIFPEKIREELIERENERFNLKMLDSRSKFKLSNGFGYYKIAGIFGVKRNISNDLVKNDAFYELSAAIFGKDHPKVIELKKRLIFPEKIREELIERENERFNLKTTTLRQHFMLLNGITGYIKLAGIFGVKRKTKNDFKKDDAFYELSVAIFGEDNENVKKLKQEIENKNLGLEQIRKELLEREEERFKLKSTDLRPKFKLSNGFGYLKIARIFGIKRNRSDDLKKDDAFYELSVAIFGEDHQKVIELKERLKL